MYKWKLEHGTYYLYDKETDKMLHGIADGRGIGLVYSKGDGWILHKHGDPQTTKPYCEKVNEEIANWPNAVDALDGDLEMRHHFIEIFPKGKKLDQFNWVLESSCGTLQKFLEVQYITFEA